MRKIARVVGLAAVIALAGCRVGPDYMRPAMEVPAAYKEGVGWTVARPADALPRGAWWEIYHDAQLSTLLAQVSISNQNIQIAEANYRQAQALVRQARAAYFPSVFADVSASRSLIANGSGGPRDSLSLGLDASWEIDLWGRIARNVEANRATAQATAADLEAIRLSTQSALAQNYFLLRLADVRRRILDSAVANFRRSQQLTQNQYNAGIVARADVVQAQTQLKATLAQSVAIGIERAQLEHAIATLIGRAPADFSLPPIEALPSVPAAPDAVPSVLLQRRPDIAAAERRAAAANERIGVAQAAFYPTLSLSAAAGFAGSSFAGALTAPGRFWTLGASLAQVLFDGGLRRALTDAAIASYDANAAAYRQTVLGGFQEVEDNLIAQRILEQQAQIQDEAVASARRSVELATNQYKAGLINYLSVVILQTSALNAETTAAQILASRLTTHVALIRALGGGWDAALLPDATAVGEPPR